jgi:hypothetical protein
VTTSSKRSSFIGLKRRALNGATMAIINYSSISYHKHGRLTGNIIKNSILLSRTRLITFAICF